MKIVRDNYDPERLKSRKTESETEFWILLRAKLVEEASEVMVATDVTKESKFDLGANCQYFV